MQRQLKRIVHNSIVCTGNHAVHFYESDVVLAAHVAGFLSSALQEGGTAVAVALPEHLDAIAAHLPSAPNLTLLDARATLDQLLVDGKPDLGRFDVCVKEPLRSMRAAGGPLHVYGEMVDILLDEENEPALFALESMWEDIVDEIGFSLLCGYTARTLAPQKMATTLAQVCDAHRSVLP